MNYLIATPIKETWPKKKNSKLFFLSESALLNFDDASTYKKVEINEFKWTNKKIFGEDFKYLLKIYEKFLTLISYKLNKIHDQNYSIKFWRILIGPWLSTFIHIYFERWNNVKTSLKKIDINKCIFLTLEQEYFIPYDNKNFINFSQNDLWNQFLYQCIISQFINKKKIKYLKITEKKIKNQISNSILKKFNQKNSFQILKNNFLKSFNIFNAKEYQYFLFDTYLGFNNELKLSRKFNQMPIIITKNYTHKIKKTNKNIRNEICNCYPSKNFFEKNLIKSISDFFPKIFLENFQDLENFSEHENLPQKPRVIFTSGSLWYDTKISYHIAKLAEKKTKLVYGQHGGCIGMVKYHWPEKHEIKISDNYLTWGWGHKKDKKIKRFYFLKNFKKIQNRGDNLLIPLRARKRYFHSLESSSGTETYSSYIKNIEQILKKINKNILKKTILRLPYKSLKVDDIDYFSSLEGKYKFYSKDSFFQACSKSKLIIHTSNSTPFLETMSANVPSILLINKLQNPLRKDCIKIFELLFKNKILFYDIKNMVKFINSIWCGEIDMWWNSKETQKTINIFNNVYVRKNDQIVNKCYNFLNRL